MAPIFNVREKDMILNNEEATEIPAGIFIDAIKLAQMPCLANQEGHPAVKVLTDWWNSTVQPEFQSAYGLSLYVRYGSDWMAGDPEEPWTSAQQFEKHSAPMSEGYLLGGRVMVNFFTHSVDSECGYDAKSVDGSNGSSGGRWPGITGDGILTRYSHEALDIFPKRFPDAWCELMIAQIDQAKTKSQATEFFELARSYLTNLSDEELIEYPNFQKMFNPVKKALAEWQPFGCRIS